MNAMSCPLRADGHLIIMTGTSRRGTRGKPRRLETAIQVRT